MIDFEDSISNIIEDTTSNAFYIKPDEALWSAMELMTPFLQNYTDAMVVKEDDLIYGGFGGRELLWKTMLHPNWEFFKDKTVLDLPLRKINEFDSNAKLIEVLEEWEKMNFNFSLVKTNDGFKNIFSKNVLKYFVKNHIPGKLKDIPKKPTITFSTDDTVEFIVKTMIESKCRKLVLEGTHQIIDDRKILEKIVNDYNFLKNRDNFLSEKASIFSTKNTLDYPPDLEIEKICSIMINQPSPIVFSEERVITPNDIITYAKTIVK